jgi:hypothetical protein
MSLKETSIVNKDLFRWATSRIAAGLWCNIMIPSVKLQVFKPLAGMQNS